MKLSFSEALSESNSSSLTLRRIRLASPASLGLNSQSACVADSDFTPRA